MTARCDWSDLPADQCACAHCKPQVRVTVDAAHVKTTFTAQYNSPCDHCEGRIREDERMGFDQDGNRICERCLP
jgi:hypothetical protein